MKLVVSTTRVSPSQQPMESPIHGAHAVGAVLGVQPDEAHVVDHLHPDGHRVLGLHDLVVVVVELRQHHRPG